MIDIIKKWLQACLAFFLTSLSKTDSKTSQQDSRTTQDIESKPSGYNTLKEDDTADDEDDAVFQQDWSYNQSAATPADSSKAAEEMQDYEESAKKQDRKAAIGQFDETKHKTKKEEQLDEDPDYFGTTSNSNTAAISFQNNRIPPPKSSVQPSRFERKADDEEDANNGWVDDIEIEL